MALLAKKEAEAKQDNSVLAQANAKFEETIALLKQDLSNTENQIASKQQELVAAENAVSVAQKGVETAMKLRESAQKFLPKRSWPWPKPRESTKKTRSLSTFSRKRWINNPPDSNSTQKVLGRLAEINGLN